LIHCDISVNQALSRLGFGRSYSGDRSPNPELSA
jgi:hypothetical protein